MHNITFISTVHDEIGKCNADELCKIIEKIKPEVIFLEALEDTYSKYEYSLFLSYGIYHNKLEISAIQKYCCNDSFKYIPVLDKELSDAFDRKCRIVCEYIEWQKLVDYFNYLAKEQGFQFLNSVESIKLQEEMRMLENHLLNDSAINKATNESIDAYENSMMRNIYSYCRNNQFNAAIFMCGVAHRKSIIKKIDIFNAQEELNLNWLIF